MTALKGVMDPLEAAPTPGTSAPSEQPEGVPAPLKGVLDPLAAPAVETPEPVAAPDPIAEAEATGDMPVMKRILGSISGESRREFDYPELPQEVWVGGEPKAVQADTIAAHGNPIGMAEIFSERLPDVPVEFDAHGNPYAVFSKGEDEHGRRRKDKFYLNRPGPSVGDIAETFVDLGSMVAGGRLGGAAGGAVLGTAGRVIGTGVGTGASSVAMDKIGNILGSDRPIDWMRADILAALGMGGEVIVPLASKFLGAIFGSKKMFKAGKLTPAGEEALKKANIDPEVVTPDFARIFLAEARGAVSPAEAAVAAEAKALPTPVRLSRGDVSRDVSQQSFEEAAVAGARGDPAKNVLVPFREAQQAELRANIPGIQERLGGGQVAEVGQGAAVARTAAQAAEQRSRAAIDKAYEAARATDATLPADVIEMFGTESRRLLLEGGYDIAGMPSVARRLADIQRAKNMPGNAQIKINAMETWRKRLVRDIESVKASNPSEAAALRDLKSGYDSFKEAAIDSALLKGDAAAIELWTKAVGMRAQHGRIFGDNKIITKFIKDDVTAEQAANYLFGAGRLGGQAEAATSLKALKAIIGKDSQAFGALKEEAFLRLLKSQPGTLGKDMQPLFSGAHFAKDLNAAMRNSPTLMRELFAKDELALLMRFKDTALRATTTVRHAGNPSGTAHELARMAEAIVGRSGRLTNIIVSRFGRRFAEEQAGFRAGQATQQTLEPVKLFPPGMGGGAVAAGGAVLPQEGLESMLPGQ